MTSSVLDELYGLTLHKIPPVAFNSMEDKNTEKGSVFIRINFDFIL